MIQVNAVQAQAESHRADLAAAGSRRARRTAKVTNHETTQRSAAGLPVTGGRAVRRTRARVGAWLIGFGTRLGGTAIRTSP